jgi:hypothetical protein
MANGLWHEKAGSLWLMAEGTWTYGEWQVASGQWFGSNDEGFAYAEASADKPASIRYQLFSITRYASRGMCLGLVSSRIPGGNSRLLAAFEMPMVRSVVHLRIE